MSCNEDGILNLVQTAAHVTPVASACRRNLQQMDNPCSGSSGDVDYGGDDVPTTDCLLRSAAQLGSTCQLT